MPNRRLSAALVFALMLAAPASAQLAAEGGPIYVSSDRTESLELERKVILTGNVDIQQAGARLRADTVTLQFTGRNGPGGAATIGSGFGQVQSLIADGKVFYITPELKAKGDRGIYDLASDTITLTGKVALLRDRDVAEGQKLVLEVGKRKTTLDGGTGRAFMRIDPSSQPTRQR